MEWKYHGLSFLMCDYWLRVAHAVSCRVQTGIKFEWKWCTLLCQVLCGNKMKLKNKELHDSKHINNYYNYLDYKFDKMFDILTRRWSAMVLVFMSVKVYCKILMWNFGNFTQHMIIFW